MKRSKSMATPSRLKIGFILDTSLDPTDGVQQYVVALGEWLRAEGHDVHYLVGQTETRQLPNIHSLSRNVEVVFNGNRTTIPLAASRRRLRRFIRREHFDILHVQTPHHPLLAQRLILAAGPQTAVIGTFHILPYGWTSRIGIKLLGRWLRPSLRRLDRLVSVSPAAAEFAAKSFGIQSDVLPNVIDYEHFHSAQPFGRYDDDVRTIVFLGRLVPRKGALLLLQAITLLKQRGDLPPYRVVLCGKGPLEKRLRDYIHEQELGNVELTGFVSEDDKPRYYASADIAVFPSLAGESFGIVLLEAMASGRAAVLAGDNPGYRSVMSPHPELLFETTPQQLAEKLATYLRDDAVREAAAAWGSSYTADFDVAVVGRQLEQIYGQALRKLRRQ